MQQENICNFYSFLKIKNNNKQFNHKTLLKTQNQFSSLCKIRIFFQIKKKKNTYENTDVQILMLACAQIVCNIVYVQVRGRIHRKLCCKN
jgi:hypothetical protein